MLQAASASGHHHAALSQALSRLANLGSLVRAMASASSKQSTASELSTAFRRAPGSAAPAATPPVDGQGEAGEETMKVLVASRPEKSTPAPLEGSAPALLKVRKPGEAGTGDEEAAHDGKALSPTQVSRWDICASRSWRVLAEQRPMSWAFLVPAIVRLACDA